MLKMYWVKTEHSTLVWVLHSKWDILWYFVCQNVMYKSYVLASVQCGVTEEREFQEGEEVCIKC